MRAWALGGMVALLLSGLLGGAALLVGLTGEALAQGNKPVLAA
jgi:hypothetical protein